MSYELFKVLPILEYLNHCSQSEQKKLISQAPASLIKNLTNFCYNLNKGNVTQNPSVIDKFKPYRKVIAALCKKKPSIKKRCQLLQSGGFLNLLLSTLVPLLASALSQKK